MKYLVIDDDRIFSEALARALTRSGHQASTAQNSETALRLCKDELPDRIILDLKLGTESGLHLISRLKEALPSSNIVLLTGYSSIPTTVQAIKLGATNYLCKPADLNEIEKAFGDVSNDESDPSNVVIPDTPLSVERLEWEHIQRILAKNDGNVSATARDLGMHRRTLQRKLLKRPHKN